MSNGSDEAKARQAHQSVWAGFGASLRADAEAKRRAAEEALLKTVEAEAAAADAEAALLAAEEAEAKAKGEPAPAEQPELPHIGTEEERDGVMAIVPTAEQLDAMSEDDVWSYLCTLAALGEAIGHAVASSRHAAALAMRVHQEIGRRVSDLVGPVAKPEKRKRKPTN